MKGLIFIYVLLVALMIVSMWTIFVKAGKPGWACIIPIYNILVLLEIVGKPGWWFLMYLIPGVNIVFAVWTVNMLSKSFGKTEGFTIGLLLLPFIFYPLMAFSKDIKYVQPYGLLALKQQLNKLK